MWLSWQAARTMAIVLLVVALVSRRVRARGAPALAATTFEMSLVFALYALWQWAHDLAVTQTAGAEQHARWVWRVERTMHLPSEVTVQRLALHSDLFVQFLNIFYATAHVPAVGIMLVWLFFKHRDRYAPIRNALALTTAWCLMIQHIPVAPPRMLPDLGFIDTGLRFQQSVYGTGGSGISNQLAAMPSLHVGWALLVGFAAVTVSRSKWRWLVLAHPILTVIAVVATANHWWLDGIVAGLLLAGAFVVVRVAGAGVARLRIALGLRPAGLTGAPVVSLAAEGAADADGRSPNAEGHSPDAPDRVGATAAGAPEHPALE